MSTLISPTARSVADLTAGVILASVEIAAPPERVFRALTDPNELIRWWGSPDTYRTEEWTADLRVGGRWRARGHGVDGRAFTVQGEFLEVDPPRRLAQTWSPDWEGGFVTTITYRLDPIEGGTRLTLRHEGFGEHRDACRSHGQGWERVLGWLRAYVSAPDATLATERRGLAARYFNPLRLSAYLLVLYAMGHTTGALLSSPPFGPAADAVRSSMQSVHFQCQGSNCTWFGFYLGFGYLVSVFFLLSAGLMWFLGGLGPGERRRLLPLTWMLFLSQAAGAVIAWTWFFIAPQVFSTLVAALLGLECFRTMKRSQP
jgi:uncharacterized protein YndB with AHSA1/START domain